MILRCLPVLALLLGLSGCLPRPAALAAPVSPVAVEQAYVSNVESPEAKSLFYFSQAKLMGESGDFDGAAESLQQAIQLDPHSAFLRLALAEIYLKQDEEEAAIRAAEDALIQDPSSVEANLFLGRVYFSLGEDEQAANYLMRAIELDPEQEPAQLHLGVAFARAGKMDRAVEVFKELIHRNGSPRCPSGPGSPVSGDRSGSPG
jgi:pentatricopeptide repeat protein